jgi:hypothetical protein
MSYANPLVNAIITRTMRYAQDLVPIKPPAVIHPSDAIPEPCCSPE